MSSRLDDIREYVEAATPGPWEVEGHFGKPKGSYYEHGGSIGNPAAFGGDVVIGGSTSEHGDAVGVIKRDDAEFIANIRQDALLLLAVCEVADITCGLLEASYPNIVLRSLEGDELAESFIALMKALASLDAPKLEAGTGDGGKQAQNEEEAQE